MRIAIFVGPTLSRDEVPLELGARVLPPAAVGDVYRAARAGCAIIAIIDGYFDQVPPIWHKEILWAMSQGVHVFGASSMGALRAAELGHFGMEGIGTIFEQLRDGKLEDDDEVAVAHASAEHGFRALSEAMVNMRSTLGAALAGGYLSTEHHHRLVALAKHRHFFERSYQLLLSDAADDGLPPEVLAKLCDWLAVGRVDQKRDDALLLIQHLRELVERGVEQKQVGFVFEHTHFWEELCREIDGEVERQVTTATDDRLLDELRDMGALQTLSDAALGRVLAVSYAQRIGRMPTPDAASNALDAFRRDHGLLSGEAFVQWISDNELDNAGLKHFAMEEACVRWIEGAVVSNLPQALRNHLRATGEYATLIARTRKRPL